jgi:hypothetical protein
LNKSSTTPKKKQYPNTIIVLFVIAIISVLVWFFLFNNGYTIINEERRLNSTEIENPPEIPKEETSPNNQGTIKIGNSIISFDPTKIETLRQDIFNPGFFSVFDVLVYTHSLGEIELKFHFDEEMNTHIIDSLNNEKNWWYEEYYTGGWSEKNVFRPDHYPWKDGTTLTFYKESAARIESIYAVWKEEINRKNNNQVVIIPNVEIRSKTFTKEFKNVEVESHNLRNDVFKNGTITAIDVILSLEEQNEISCELQWYESIGSAGIVKSYWVEAINNDRANGRCGYVYEAGSTQFPFFSGNHIHLPSDTRVLNSPEYVEFFWICI